MLVEKAYAKVNLALHVTDLHDNGYHQLQSIVTFADIHDVLTLDPKANGFQFSMDGPFADDLDQGSGNLIIKAVQLLADHYDIDLKNQHFHLQLTKNLPLASGIGGGSADAAAALRMMNNFWRLDLALDQLAEIGTKLGADVPMCVYSKPAFATGTGTKLRILQNFPEMNLLLINPLIQVSTPMVFKKLENKQNPVIPDQMDTIIDWTEHLKELRNDLQAPASKLAHEINNVLECINQQGNCQLARMSGSGATCFALFTSQDEAIGSANMIQQKHPEWWVQACQTIS